MEEIKVGEYVRTKDGKILKIDGQMDMIYIEHGNPYFRQNITKHSPNIIDLIEIDDFVKLGKNCYPLRVDCIWHNGEELNIELEGDRRFEDIKENKEFIIYSVVTHEQFAQIEYKLED